MSGGHEHGGGHEGGTGKIAPAVWWFLAVSVVVVMIQGSFVVGSSGHGKVWPASDAAKIVLPEAK